MESYSDILTSSGHYGDVLRRRMPLLVGGIVLSLLLGFLAFTFVGDSSSNTSARATSTVEVKPVTANRFGSNTRNRDLVTMATEVEIAGSGTIAQRVVERLGLDDDPDDLLDQLTVTNPNDTLVLDIDITASSTEMALQLAQAFAEEYVAFRTEGLTATIDQSISQISANADTTREALADAIDERAQLGGQPAVAAQLDARIVQLNLRLADLEEQVAVLRGIFVDPGRVVSDASATTSSSTPAWITAAGIVGVGLMLTLGVVVFADRADDHPREVGELLEIVPAPVFGVGGGPQRAAGRDEEGGADEYRRLRLLLGTSGVDVGRLLVTSPEDDDAAGEVAVNLCRVAALAQERVALVWNDRLSSSSLNSVGASLDRTLDQVLVKGQSIDSAFISVPHTSYMTLLVLPAGMTASISAAQLRDIYARLDLRFDLVVTVASSAGLADAAELAVYADASVIAIDCPSVTREAIARTTKALTAVNDRVVGLFVTRSRRWWK